jgi:hypothetical protein
LHADLEERVLIEPPEGYEKDPNIKWRLKKALYGLKQAPREWFKKVIKIMLELKFSQCPYESCVYSRGFGANRIIVLVFVDDFLVCGQSRKEVDRIKSQLKEHLTIKDMGEVKTFLNLVIKRNRENRTMSVSQRHFVDELKRKFNDHIIGCPRTPITHEDLEEEEKGTIEEQMLYLQIFGSLNYLCTWTRPDLAFAMSILGRYLQNPSKKAIRTVKQALSYTINTKNLSITLGRVAQDNGILGYSDANWGKDVEDGKSRTGLLLLLYGSPITWKSKKQTVIARSTAEAEYIAGASIAREMLWARQFLSYCGEELSESSPVLIDNQAVVKLSGMAASSKKIRHLALPYHQLRQMVSDNIIKVNYVNTKNQLADYLTKAVSRFTLRETMDKIGMCDNSEIGV